MAAKAGGGDPHMNPRLRLLIQNAKAENMPKENVERAIKKATDKDTKDYKEIVYEGKGPSGVATSKKVSPTSIPPANGLKTGNP